MGATQSSPLRLYYDPLSSNSVRVLMYLNEAGLPYELVKVDLLKGEHKGEDFAKLNPRQQVPFLVHGDVKIGESVGIIEYLGRIYPNESLFPTKDHESCSLNCKHIAEFHQKLDPINIFGSVVFQGKKREDLGEERIQKVFKEIGVWEDYFAQENDYLLGDRISTADIIIFPNIACAFYLMGLSETEYPFLANWYHRMRARPSVAKLEFWKALQPKSEWRVLQNRTLQPSVN